VAPENREETMLPHCTECKTTDMKFFAVDMRIKQILCGHCFFTLPEEFHKNFILHCVM